MLIRAEKAGEIAAIHELLLSAYGQPQEADMIDKLRKDPGNMISMVAEIDGRVVGHVSFSPVSLEGNPGLKLTGMSSVAVLPEFRDKGIGSELIHEGLVASHHVGAVAVITLGYPDYYDRFGFVPGEKYGFRCEYATADDQFLIRILEPKFVEGCSGTVRYPAAFSLHPAAGS